MRVCLACEKQWPDETSMRHVVQDVGSYQKVVGPFCPNADCADGYGVTTSEA